jgi:hypothetical protein
MLNFMTFITGDSFLYEAQFFYFFIEQKTAVAIEQRRNEKFGSAAKHVTCIHEVTRLESRLLHVTIINRLPLWSFSVAPDNRQDVTYATAVSLQFISKHV